MGKSPKKYHRDLMNPNSAPMSKAVRYGAQNQIDIIHRTNAIRRKNEARRNDPIQKVTDWIGGAGHTINNAIGYENAQALKNIAGGLLVHGVKTGLTALTGIPFGSRAKGVKTLPRGKNFPKRTTNKNKTGNVSIHKYKKGTLMC